MSALPPKADMFSVEIDVCFVPIVFGSNSLSLSQSLTSEDPNPIVIRDPVPDDEGAWRNLWAGYCAFYETKVPEAVTAATWARMLTPGSQLFGRLAEWKGEVAGLTISVLHASTWTLARICYL